VEDESWNTAGVSSRYGPNALHKGHSIIGQYHHVTDTFHHSFIGVLQANSEI
jgi:hypothetical protein